MFNKKWFHVAVAGGVLLDQLTKYVAETHLISPISFFNLLIFQLVHNSGAAYGILQGHRFFLLGVSLCVILMIYIFLHRTENQQRLSQWGFLFFLIGAWGNFIDRLFRGYVIDFINIHIFPVFNLSDMSIDLGAVLLLISLFIYDQNNRRA